MTTLRSRIEQLEEQQWRELIEEVDTYLAGRSVEDVEFFCVHGYLPGPLHGPTYAPYRLSWKERWKEWKKHERQFTSRSVEEREFFCVHGHWPSRSKGRSDGNA